MKREDDQELWDLLGRAAQPEISPFFARNVLRRARAQERRFASRWKWIGLRSLVPATSLVAAFIAAFVITHSPLDRQEAADNNDPVARIDPEDYEVVVDLDELLASEDTTNLWDENSSL